MSHHHGHHMSNHDMASTPDLSNTTIATVMNAVMTTVMAHSMHHPVTEANHDMVHDSMDTPVHDNSHHTSLNDHGSSSDDHMPMYFHSGVNVVILFHQWTVSTTGGMVGSIIGIFLLAMLYEGLKFFREFLFKRYFSSLLYSSVSVMANDGKTVTEIHKVARNRMFSWPHAVQTFLHIIQMLISYFLMLIFMTYNIWLCIAVILGAGFGYFLFGWKKATVVDVTEHCH